MEKAVSGPLVGQRLEILPSSRVKWKTWRNRNPATKVLSTDTGYSRNYAIDPYEGYYRIGSLMFPVGDVRQDLPAKEPVLGIQIGDHAKAYQINQLRANPGVQRDVVGNHAIRIEISPAGEVVAVQDEKGRAIVAIYSYWFAWQAFHPDTEVHQP